MTDDKIKKAYRELSALIDGGTKMTEWMDIKTAPKDGTEILTIQMHEGDYFKRQAIMYWYLPPAQYRWNLTDDDTMKRFPIPPIGYWRGEIFLNPTHWMPLPNAPEPPK